MEKFTTTGDDTLPKCEFTSPNGKSFVGWNTKKDRTGTVYNDQGKINPYSDTTLYAMWGNEAKVTLVTGASTEYSTFSAALKEATKTSGNTLTLLQDVFVTEVSIPTSAGDFTLDLNGNDLSNTSSGTGYLYTIKNSSANFVIDDSSSSKNGHIYYTRNEDSSLVISNLGNLTIKGGTIENTGTGEKNYAIRVNSYSDEITQLTVQGGTITSNSNTIELGYKTSITVTDGTITSKTGNAIHTDTMNTSITVTGGTITSETGNAISGSDNLIISGGTITSTQNYAINYCNKLTLSGAPVINGKNADIRFSNLYFDSNLKNIIAGKLEMAPPLKITDGKETTSYYYNTTVFTAGEGYTITQEDVNKLKFVDSTGADYKWTSSSATETLIFKLDSSKKAIVIGEST